MTAGQSRFPVAPSKWGFKQYGQCGRWVTDLLPQTGKVVDDMAFLYSMHTDAINHEPAILMMNTGNMIPGKPSLGAWLAYGLGSVNHNLPTYVVLEANFTLGNDQPINSRLWGSGFLSSRFAGVMLRSDSEPVFYLNDPAGMSAPHPARDARCGQRPSIGARTSRPPIPKRTPGSANMKWLSGCRRACQNWRTCPTSRKARGSCTGRKQKEPGSYAYCCLMARRPRRTRRPHHAGLQARLGPPRKRRRPPFPGSAAIPISPPTR